MKRIIALAVILTVGSAMATYAADAKTIYDKDCAKCHGKEGKGDTKMGQKLGVKDYTTAKVQAEMKDDEAFKAIKEGYKDKAGKVVMKPAEGVTDEEIKGLVKYMRSFKK